MTDLITKYVPKALISVILFKYIKFENLKSLCKGTIQLTNFLSNHHKKTINTVYNNMIHDKIIENNILKIDDINVLKYYLLNTNNRSITTNGIVDCLNKPNIKFLDLYYENSDDQAIDELGFWEITMNFLSKNKYTNSDTLITFINRHEKLMHNDHPISYSFNHTNFGFLLENYNYETVKHFLTKYNQYKNHCIDSEFIKTYLYHTNYLTINGIINILYMINEKYIDESTLVSNIITKSILNIIKSPYVSDMIKMSELLLYHYGSNNFFGNWFNNIPIEYVSRFGNTQMMEHIFTTRKQKFVMHFDDILSVAILDRNIIITKLLFSLPIKFNYKSFLHQKEEYLMRMLCCDVMNKYIKECEMVKFLSSLDQIQYGKFDFEIQDNVILRTACMNEYKYNALLALQNVHSITPQALYMAVSFVCNKRNNKLFNKMIQYDFIRCGLMNESINARLVKYADYKCCYKIKNYICNMK